MIVDTARSTVLSSMGWVDGDALWRLDVATGRVETIPLESGARSVSIGAGDGDRFAAAHHFDGKRFEITVRAFDDVSAVIGRTIVDRDGQRVEGDRTVWAGVPRLYLEYLALPPWNDFVLVKIDGVAGRVEIQALTWYDQTYDKDYQGVVDVLELPDRRHAVVSVQRSSTLIVHDLETGARRRSIDLGGRSGNPRLHYRGEDGTIWATDYDTIVVVGVDDWSVRRRARLQDAAAGVQQFVGDISFAPDAAFCAVARPFSGDVIGVSAKTLRVQNRAALGAQPLAVAVLAGGAVVARDWKTGSLLQGDLRPW